MKRIAVIERCNDCARSNSGVLTLDGCGYSVLIDDQLIPGADCPHLKSVEAHDAAVRADERKKFEDMPCPNGCRQMERERSAVRAAAIEETMAKINEHHYFDFDNQIRALEEIAARLKEGK